MFYSLFVFYFFLLRSADGCTLMFSSTDGYCSMISFDENELGTPVDADKVPVGMKNYPGFMINEVDINEFLIIRIFF